MGTDKTFIGIWCHLSPAIQLTIMIGNSKVQSQKHIITVVIIVFAVNDFHSTMLIKGYLKKNVPVY